MKITKSGRNDFAKYNYMELGDFLIPTQQIFSEIGLCGVVSFSKDIATLTITDVDDGSEIVLTSPMGSAALKGCHEVQNVGAVETYQRRYLWVSAMEIVEHDAIDSSKPIERKIIHLPTGEPAVGIERLSIIADVAESIKSHIDSDDLYGAYEDYSYIVDEEEKVALWKLLPSGIRSALKKYGQSINTTATT